MLKASGFLYYGLKYRFIGMNADVCGYGKRVTISIYPFFTVR